MIDKIRAASKPPAVKRKTIVEKGNGKELSAKEENKLRIEKMKRLYGLYKQFEAEKSNEVGDVPSSAASSMRSARLNLPDVK